MRNEESSNTVTIFKDKTQSLFLRKSEENTIIKFSIYEKKEALNSGHINEIYNIKKVEFKEELKNDLKITYLLHQISQLTGQDISENEEKTKMFFTFYYKETK